MTHGLAKFDVRQLVDKAQSATALIDTALDQGEEGGVEALMEAVRIALENQIEIARTLELIKQEFDKFEEGLGKIL